MGDLRTWRRFGWDSFLRRFGHDHQGRTNQAFALAVPSLNLEGHDAGSNICGFEVLDGLVHARIERQSDGAYALDSQTSESVAKLTNDQIDTVGQTFPVVTAVGCLRVLDGAFEVVENWQQVLEQVVATLALGVGQLAACSLAKVVEICGRAQQLIFVAQRLGLSRGKRIGSCAYAFGRRSRIAVSGLF